MNNHLELLGNNSIRIAVTGVLCILALFLLVETAVTAKDYGRASAPATNTVTVTGTGQTALAPDIARITFSVENTDTTVADAQSATTKQANAAIAYVAAQGIADKDVTTLSYNISPQYSYPAPCTSNAYCPVRSPKITGYSVSETVQVTVRDLTKVSGLLQGLGQQNVQNISGPNFGLNSPTAGQDAARKLAIDNAKEQAETLAAQLGVRLVRIVSFSDNAGGYPVYGMGVSAKAMDMASSVAPAPMIPTGQNTYTDNVSITYEIR